MNFTILLIWDQTTQEIFIRQVAYASFLHVEAQSHQHYASEACHTLKISHSFTVRSFEKKKLNLMIFRTVKQVFVKTPTSQEKWVSQALIVQYRGLKQVTTAHGYFFLGQCNQPLGTYVRCLPHIWSMLGQLKPRKSLKRL